MLQSPQKLPNSYHPHMLTLHDLWSMTAAKFPVTKITLPGPHISKSRSGTLFIYRRAALFTTKLMRQSQAIANM